ncbi:helix-turn-helix domain-containing protein [Brevibacillus fulvus]|uniref:Transcriptional regulator with XRE-family HTH domain n=1 Tax=Brevibacillus fulvus TaxID=1125967 RepID=A0A939BW99_9BACL|nr:helix-turn-helix transcriptional regulator [Brevibacillus fulvus]MBM7592219.1 transcriptional regulator with XRE-family HTH domain [Brevibacillus fulvus]
MDNIFGERLRILREEKNLKQEELGEVLGVGKVTIHGYESGKRKPSFEILIQIANYFQVTTDYLLGLTTDRTPPAKIDIINQNAQKLNEFLAELDKNKQDQFFEFLEVYVNGMKASNRPE